MKDGALVVQQAGGVETANESRARVVVFAVSGLVAETPHDDAGVVAVALDHAADSFEPGRAVRRVMAQRGVEGVALHVRFVHHVETEFVAQIAEAVIVRIVRGADRIDVVSLHREQIGTHSVDRDRLAAVGIVIVAIHTHHRDRRSVDRQQAVDDLDAPEAHDLTECLDHLTIR